MAVTVSLKQNQNPQSSGYKKWYPRAKYGRIIDIAGLAQHIHDHHAIYPEDVVRGVLQCATRCTRELMLEGYPVKFDGLGIFKASVENVHGFDRPANATLLIGGSNGQGRPIGIQAIKMLCQASGEFTRKELSESSILQWSDLAESIIAEDKKKLEESGTGDNSGENNGGSESLGGGTGTITPSGGDNNGGNSGNGGSSQSATVDAPSINGNTSFSDSTQVTMSGPEGAEIRYTTDGSVPTSESTLYSEAFSLSATTTVKAIAIKDGVSSEVTSKTFTKSTGGDDSE